MDGGCIGVHNLLTGENSTITDWLPGESCIAMFFEDDAHLVGGTTISTHGGHVTVTDASVFRMDWNTRKVVNVRAKDATVNSARIANCKYTQFPEFEDFGEASLTSDNGVSFYYRVDWYTPDGLSSWGDGRTLIVGTDGYIELRKFVDVATGLGYGQMYYVNKVGEYHVNAQNTVGNPFFSKFILDCIHRTENAMTQERAFKAAELLVEIRLWIKDVCEEIGLVLRRKDEGLCLVW